VSVVLKFKFLINTVFSRASLPSSSSDSDSSCFSSEIKSAGGPQIFKDPRVRISQKILQLLK
ncbi:MAG: hypothetical protein QMC27_07495, partial [Flavobacteriaceae bacterium]